MSVSLNIMVPHLGITDLRCERVCKDHSPVVVQWRVIQYLIR